MDILNFNSSLAGSTVLNFGVSEDELELSTIYRKIDINTTHFNVLYIEFLRVPIENKNVLRYFKFNIVNNDTEEVLYTESSKYLRSENSDMYSTVIDLESFLEFNISVVLKFAIEQVEDTLEYKSIENFNVFIGQ